MLAPWAQEEMASADLNDSRLNKRLVQLLSDLGDRPSASIPAACGGFNEMTAAYRFFDNDKATFERILEPHYEVTCRRIAAQPVAVLVQDTTEIDLTRPSQPVMGAGPLDGNLRVGVFLHLLHAFTPDGTPLGTVDAALWTREDEVKCATLTRAQRAAIPIEEKESYRWITTFLRAREAAKGCPGTRCVCVSDSESDIYELLDVAQEEPGSVDWILRACQNRALLAANEAENQERTLRNEVLSAPVLFTQNLKVRGRKLRVACDQRGRRQPREGRTADVSVRATTVALRPPSRRDRALPALTVNVVLVLEENPPAGEEPIEWLLLTNLSISSEEAVQLIIEYYTTRWMIEILFRVLKSGCRVEERRFEQLDRLLSCLAVYLIVAWRTLLVCRLGRSCPEVSCEVLFEPAEWRSTWKIARREDPPKEAPPLGVLTRLVAELGGYIPRKSSPPGPQTTWLGLQRVHDFALCWQTFGPDARHGP
jgi:Transposase DNA-binding/Transposase Tn5 dimerisation domain